jgi:DUF1680 family protein
MRTLTPVPHTQVTLSDAFWAPRIQRNRDVTIPHVRKQLAETGRLDALDLNWRLGMPNRPHHFWDSDTAKWIEAASLSLATHPDPALEADLDVIIAQYARLQHPSGYVNSYFQGIDPSKRWTNLRDAHELYCAGHLIEAAVAHFEATGKRNLLDIVTRQADHIGAMFGWGASQRRGYPGHEEIELALVKLARATGEPRHFALAKYFIDARGGQPHYYEMEAKARGDDPRTYWAKTYEYLQAHKPLREQTEVVGHAVRAMYLYSGATDVATESGDAGLFAVLEGLWQHLASTRLFVTGGLGTSGSNEGFTRDYDLPDEEAYAETCAAIGLVLWCHRMLQVAGESKYADLMERALYNGFLSGISLDGAGFFYENPLASRGQHARLPWYDCACCPPNVARMLAGLSGYTHSVSEDGISVHLYAAGTTQARVAGGPVHLTTKTCYPWDGEIDIAVDGQGEFALLLRLPGWCQHWRLSVNDAPLTLGAGVELQNGYLTVRRDWRPGDRVALRLGMPVRFTHPHPDIRQMAGRVAVERGPLVYCLEAADHPGEEVERLAVDVGRGAAALTATHEHDTLGGVTVLRGTGLRLAPPAGLYAASIAREPAGLTFIPYYAWANRGKGAMRVWVRA